MRIEPDLRRPSDHAPLLVDLPIAPENICVRRMVLKRDSEEVGQSVTLCARATRAILNHAPIGEYRQRFFPAECTQCPCGHCQVETCRHILANCSRFAHSPLIDPSPSIKDFVDFLKEHPSAFAFSSQEQPPTPPEPP